MSSSSRRRSHWFFQAAQPLAERAAPDPHPAARQPHDRRSCLLAAPAVERGPRHPQLGGHLLDRQQRVIRGTGVFVRGGGGPAGSGWRSRGRPVRGSATTDAPLRPPRQVRPPPGRRRQAAARGCLPGERRREEGPHGRPVRRGGCGRAARPCRRGRPAGAGAGSRAVTDGTPSPSPGVEAAGPAAGRRGRLACRLGPQASSLHSGRHVKPARPGAGTGLAPGPAPGRAGTGLCPPGPEGAALGEGRPPGGYREGGTVARTAKVRATVVPAPATGGQPRTGVPACGQRVTLIDRSVMAWSVPYAAAFPPTTEIGF